MSVVPPIIILELQKKKVSSMAIIIPVRSAKQTRICRVLCALKTCSLSRGPRAESGPLRPTDSSSESLESQIQGSAVDRSTFRYKKRDFGDPGRNSKTDHNQKDQVQWRRHHGGSLDNHRAYRVRQLILVGAHRAAFSLAHGPTRTKRLTTSAKKKAQQRRRVCEHIYCNKLLITVWNTKKRTTSFF